LIYQTQSSKKTGRGRQYLFKYPHTDILSQAGLIKHVDFKGKNGIIVLPPSIHKSGKQYEWLKINPIEDGLDDLFDLPEDIAAWIRNGGAPESSQDQRSPVKAGEGKDKGTKTRKSKNKPGWLNECLLGVPIGNRNHVCAKLAGYYIGLGNDEKETFAILKDWNKLNIPIMDHSEIKTVIKSISETHSTNSFGDNILKKKIDVFARLVYPDGNIKYELQMQGEERSLVLDIEDLTNQSRFRNRYADHTKILLQKYKPAVYDGHLAAALEETVDIIKAMDETDLDLIRRIILIPSGHQELQQYSKGLEGHLIHTAILKNREIHFNIDWLRGELRMKGINKPKQELISNVKALGFQSSQAIRGIRTWCMDYLRLKEGRHP